jgi:succinoglycan biosynthesis protein ExoU
VQPTVAVIIAAHNASETIERAIRSALGEPEVAEVLVVDDASTDDTAQVARSLDDGSGRLKVVPMPENGGPSKARNRAIEESTAPWIAVLDSDDFFLPGRIAGMLKHSDGVDLVADDLWQVSETDLDGPRRSLLGTPLVGPRSVGFVDFVTSNVTTRNRYRGELGFIKPLMRRSFLEKHSLGYKEHMRLGEDYELYARALAHGAHLSLLPAQGYISVVRAGSLSGRHTETDLLNLRDANDGISLIPGLGIEQKAALKKHYASIDCRLQWRMLILAVKKRDAVAALACFHRPHPVPLVLAGKLIEQAYLRATRNVRNASR